MLQLRQMLKCVKYVKNQDTYNVEAYDFLNLLQFAAVSFRKSKSLFQYGRSLNSAVLFYALDRCTKFSLKLTPSSFL